MFLNKTSISVIQQFKHIKPLTFIFFSLFVAQRSELKSDHYYYYRCVWHNRTFRAVLSGRIKKKSDYRLLCVVVGQQDASLLKQGTYFSCTFYIAPSKNCSFVHSQKTKTLQLLMQNLVFVHNVAQRCSAAGATGCLLFLFFFFPPECLTADS